MKKVFKKLYVQKNYVNSLPQKAKNLYEQALSFCPEDFNWNIINVNLSEKRVNFSRYSNFDEDEHPELLEYILVDLKNRRVKRKRASSNNPPILHRKETFVEADYPFYEEFKELTKQEDEAGLYRRDFLNKIGFKKFWEGLLSSKGLMIKDHKVKKASGGSQSFLFDFLPINVSKTAISRKDPSLPARISVEQGLIHGKVFDWGRGKGADIEYFRSQGIEVQGWDPAYKKDTPPESFEPGSFHWVQLSYVLNVIPEKDTRMEILKEIYEFLPKKGTFM